MNLPTLFSLIAAAIIGLLPVLLLFGRRRMMRRNRGSESAGSQPAGEASTGTPVVRGRRWDKRARDDAAPGEREILGRIVRDRRENSGEQELHDAARVAGASRSQSQRLVRGRGVASGGPAHGTASADSDEKAPGASLEARLAHLSPLQRAIAYSEILGRPAALREPGRLDTP